MTSRPLLILADDLTGACDTAGAIATRARTEVRVHLVRGRPVPFAGTSEPIAALDLDTRAAPVAAAVQHTVDAVAVAPGDVYLKIDSTLRGHVVATVAAAAGAFRARHRGCRVIVCPAFPARGRIVRDRRVVVHDEVLPSTALDELASLPGIEVADAATDQHLAAVAASVGGTPTLWAGSAGLAPHVVAMRSPPAIRPPGATVGPPAGGARSLVVVVGSTQPVSVEGAAALAAGADGRVRLVAGDPRQPSVIDAAADLVAGADALVVTGGYTARRLLDRLGVVALDVGGELEAGIAWSTAGPLTVVTKAGGFGDAGTLGRIVALLTGDL